MSNVRVKELITFRVISDILLNEILQTFTVREFNISHPLHTVAQN